MRNFFSVAIPLCLIGLIVGCAEMPPRPNPQDSSFDPDLCDHQMGFERGTNDGYYGRPMNSRFATRCREDLRKSTQEGYNQGFRDGVKRAESDREADRRTEQQTATPAPAPTQPGNGSGTSVSLPGGININIGGRQQVGTPTSSTPAQSANARAYYCKVTAFMKTFDDFGPTLIEAKRSTQAKCMARYHEMHCQEVECEKNQ